MAIIFMAGGCFLSITVPFLPNCLEINLQLKWLPGDHVRYLQAPVEADYCCLMNLAVYRSPPVITSAI